MDRIEKSKLNRKKALELQKAWGVVAKQVRYRETGDWYNPLSLFPAALFDAHGYVLFATREDYRNSPHISIGKQIGVTKPGISAIPGYVLAPGLAASLSLDVDIHTVEASEGRRRLVLHLQCERNQTLVRNKKKLSASLDCEVCGFSFSRFYGNAASDYCEVHHLKPLSEVEDSTKTQIEDLAILCANCHRVVHLTIPPFTLHEVRSMLAKR
jgi:5-methylcytosine-specific restriction endonuclease McrA